MHGRQHFHLHLQIIDAPRKTSNAGVKVRGNFSSLISSALELEMPAQEIILKLISYAEALERAGF